jgi:hypothetical protein
MGFIPGGEQRGSAAGMFRRIFWDTALAASDPLFRMLRDVAGVSQVPYGTDFPYLRQDLAVNSKQRISQSPELNDLERRAILGGNASRLSRRLRKESKCDSPPIRLVSSVAAAALRSAVAPMKGKFGDGDRTQSHREKET